MHPVKIKDRIPIFRIVQTGITPSSSKWLKLTLGQINDRCMKRKESRVSIQGKIIDERKMRPKYNNYRNYFWP